LVRGNGSVCNVNRWQSYAGGYCAWKAC
jgi:hypothetical protein